MSDKSKVCSTCGVSLTAENKSMDKGLCKRCFSAEMADIEEEDMIEDSMAERLAENCERE